MKVKNSGAKQEVWDITRKKWVALTPEEEVRQSFIEYLINTVKVPINLISVEYSLSNINPGNFTKVDIIVWRNEPEKGLKPWLVVECKSPSLTFQKKWELQVMGYASELKPSYLAVTNGVKTEIFILDRNLYKNLSSLPSYS